MDCREHMKSLGGTCNEVKIQYDNCFNTWFSEKFLKGDTNDSMCAPLFNSYQQCIKPCKDLKQNYDKCFNSWFPERFLKGDTNDAMCAPLLKVYKECVEKAMKENHIELPDAQVNHLENEQGKTGQS